MNFKQIRILLYLVMFFLIFSGCSIIKTQKTKEVKTVPQQEENSVNQEIEPKERLNIPLEEKDEVTEEKKDNSLIIKDALEEYQEALECWEKADVDNAIKYLDNAYSLILQLDDLKEEELIQEKDELRLLIAKRINEIYASHLLAVGENHNSIQLMENKYVEREIKSFQNGERKYFIDSFKRSGKFRKMILEILKEKGLPSELSWIPIVESGFKLRAYSRARALGLWQFISSTGYRYGLKRSRWIDERMDPVKASVAAASYLKELHSLFGDWPTALAAYNCGEFRVQRLIRAQKINYLDNFWDLFAMLPRETRRFVPRIMAVILIVKNPEKYGFKDLLVADNPRDYEIISVDKPVKLSLLSKEIGYSIDILSELNSELKYKTTPTEVYKLKVPKGSSELCITKIQTMKKWVPPQSRYVIHYVRRGETISHIARKYRTSVKAILSMNRLGRRSLIRPRQRLKIPGSGYRNSYTGGSSKKKISSNEYRVRRGDSLSKISYMSGVAVSTIKNLNNLKSNMLSVGQILKLKKSIPKNAKTYIVKRGDSPYSISRKFGLELKTLLRINNLSKRSRIYPGQKILVKVP